MQLYKIQGLNKPTNALSSVTFCVHEGEALGIQGESGAGKTTLLNILRGLDKEYNGTITYKNKPLSHKPAYLKEIGSIYQDAEGSLNPQHTVLRIIEEPLRVCVHQRLTPSQTKAILNDVGLQQEHLLLYPHQLSGGEKQRVAMARALILNPKVLLLDEPLCSLDTHSQEKILTALRKKPRLTIIMVSHDTNILDNFCDRKLLLKNGHITHLKKSPAMQYVL